MSNVSVNTIHNQVYQIIKKDICSGQYPPGKWLQEKELAAQLSVSRNPVREALNQLAVDGLVLKVPNKGVFVKEFTARDIEEVFAMRVLLENYAIEHVSLPLPEKEHQQLNNFLAALKEAHAKNDLRHYTTIDTQLHEAIIRLSSNSLLITMYQKVYSMIQQFRIYSLMTQKRFDESVIEHTQIINFILDGKTSEAQAINRLHLQMARDRILDYIEEQYAITKATD